MNLNAKKFEQHMSQMQSNNGDVRSRKTMKSAKYEQLDNVCISGLFKPEVKEFHIQVLL